MAATAPGPGPPTHTTANPGERLLKPRFDKYIFILDNELPEFRQLPRGPGLVIESHDIRLGAPWSGYKRRQGIY